MSAPPVAHIIIDIHSLSKILGLKSDKCYDGVFENDIINRDVWYEMNKNRIV